jgi:hypothetical protein
MGISRGEPETGMPETTEMGIFLFPRAVSAELQRKGNGKGPGEYRSEKIHIAWIVMTETNAEISITAASFFGCGFFTFLFRKIPDCHSPWGCFLLCKKRTGCGI